MHVTKVCKKAGQKLHALARVSNYTSFNQKILIFNAFISSIQLLSSDMVMSQQIVKYPHDNVSSFNELINRSGSVTVHHRNLQFLATEGIT